MRPPIECAYQGNQKNFKFNTIYGIGGILVFWFQRIFKRGLIPYLSMAASCSQDQEVSEYDKEIQQSESKAPDQPPTS